MTQPVFTCSKLTPGAPDQCKICSKLIRMTTITSFWCLYCYLWTDFSQMKWGNSSVIRQKGASQNGCYKKTKQAKFPEKPAFLSPAGVKKCLFFGKFDVLCFLVTPVLRFLPYCRRTDQFLVIVYKCFLQNCLSTIFAAYMNEDTELIEKMIGCMLGFVHVPPPGGPKLTFSIGGGDSQVLQPPLSNDLPCTSESVAVLFNQLGMLWSDVNTVYKWSLG